jgi:hypothetical protein
VQYGNLLAIDAVLRLYPVEVARHCLPLIVPAKALYEPGFTVRMDNDERIVCMIVQVRQSTEQAVACRRETQATAQIEVQRAKARAETARFYAARTRSRP